ncbi:glycosyltransferase family A protein [Cloacibacterium sp.]|uniref:glycosyltransferase family A protein n=1 Tax=Cloacibacterium sp. TaxID=1913682 RepID=UPI0039E47D37
MQTIFTPTYNRAHLLPRLYQSIICQGFENFEWLIVDDGSTDGTEELVNGWIGENKCSIRYFKTNNGGKHSAINFGVRQAKGEVFFIVDSDDVLADNALGNIETYYQSIKDNENICGVIGLSQYLNTNTIVGNYFPKNSWEVTFADVYLKYHLEGDKSVAFKTEILKKYPFPEKEGIRFVFEAVVWHEMSKKYKVLAINDKIQMVEYQVSGVSNSSYKRWYIQSLAFSFFYLIKNKTYPFTKYPHHFLWNYIHLGINSLLSGDSYFNQLYLIDKFLYLICYPRAFYTYLKLKDKIHD